MSSSKGAPAQAQDEPRISLEAFRRAVDPEYGEQERHTASQFEANVRRIADHNGGSDDEIEKMLAELGEPAPEPATESEANPNIEIEKMLADLGEDPGAKDATAVIEGDPLALTPSTLEAAKTGDMGAAITAEITTISIPEAKPIETAASEAPAPLTDVSDDEVDVVVDQLERDEEAATARADAHRNVPLSTLKILRENGRQLRLSDQQFKVRNILREVGLDLDALPGGFWDGDLLDKGLYANRKRILGEIVKNSPVQIAKRAERAEKRAAGYVARGLPADFDKRPWPEQERLRKNARQGRWRAKLKATATPATTSTPTFPPEWRKARIAELDRWLDTLPIERSRQHRPKREEIIDDLIAYRIVQHHMPGEKVPDRALAKQLGISGNGYRRSKRLKDLSAEIGGEWARSPA